MKLRSITPDSSPHLTACLILCILLHPSHRPALLSTSSLSADYFFHFKSLLSHLLTACCLSNTMFIFPAPSSPSICTTSLLPSLVKRHQIWNFLLTYQLHLFKKSLKKVFILFMFSGYFKGIFFLNFVNWRQAVCSFNHLPFKHHRTNNSKFPCMIKKFCESNHNSNF